MHTARFDFGRPFLGVLLGGMVLVGSGLVFPAPPQERPEAATTAQEGSARPPGGSTSAAPGFNTSPVAPDLRSEQSQSPADLSARPQGEERPSSGFSDFLVGTLLAIFAGFITIAPVITLAVSLVMDDGALRYLVFAAGWVFSFGSGMVVSGLLGVVAAEALGLGSGLLGSVLPVGVVAFLLAYPIAAWRGRRWAQSLPREQYIAWKQAPTGGALLGFGVGSIANLLRSAIPVPGGSGGGFGGYGGRSFGGGGAGGSWSASAGGASTSGTATSAGAYATGASAGASSGATAPAVVPGTAASASADGWGALLPTWPQRFRWIHGVLFALALLSFAVIGAWSAEVVLRDTDLLVLIVGGGGAYVGYRLWHRWTSSDSPDPDTAFQGGEASASWS